MSKFLKIEKNPSLESLEDRLVPAPYLPWLQPSVAIVRVTDDAPQILRPGQNDVAASGARVLTTDLTLTQSVRIGGQGFDKVTDVRLWDDVNANGKLDSRDREITGWRQQDRNGLTLYPWLSLNLPYREQRLLVTFDVKKDATSGKVAIGVQKMEFLNLLHGWWRPVWTYPSGSPSTDTIAAKTPTLSVVSKMTGTMDTVVRGETKTAYAMEMRATDGDVRLTSIPLLATKGNLIDGQAYTLKVNGTATATGKVASGRLTFDAPILIRNGSTVRLEMEVKIAQSITANRVLQLDIDDRIGIRAEDVRTGATLSGKNLNVYHVPGIDLKIVDQGSVFLRKSSTPVQAKHLLLGKGNDVVARYTVRAQDEIGILKSMRLWVKGNAVSVDRLDVYLPGETSPRFSLTQGGYGTHPAVAGYAGFGTVAINLALPEGSDTELIVKAVTKTDASGGEAGEPVQVELREEWNPLTVVGKTSQRNIGRNDRDNQVEGEVFVGVNAAGPGLPVISAIHVTVGMELASATAAISTPFGSNLPTGYAVLGEVALTGETQANSKDALDRMIVRDMTVRMRIAVVGGTFWLSNKADASMRVASAYVTDLNGNVLTGPIQNREVIVPFRNLNQSWVNTQIGNGEKIVLSVAGEVVNADVSSAPSSIDVFAQFGDTFGWLAGDFGGMLLFSDTDLVDDEVLIGSFRN